MNNLLLFEHERQDELRYTFNDKERIKHLQEILKKSKDDEISLCLVNISLARGIIKKLTSESCEIEIIEKLEGQSFSIKLIVAISRPPTIRKILEHGTSLGVSEFHFYKPELSEKSYLDSKLFKAEAFKQYLNNGLSQSKLFYKLPTVKLHSALPKLETFRSDQKYLLQMNALQTFNDLPPTISKSIALVLGPERGLIPLENEYFIAGGFSPIQIAPSVLRVEIASFAAVSQLFLF